MYLRHHPNALLQLLYGHAAMPDLSSIDAVHGVALCIRRQR